MGAGRWEGPRAFGRRARRPRALACFGRGGSSSAAAVWGGGSSLGRGGAPPTDGARRRALPGARGGAQSRIGRAGRADRPGGAAPGRRRLRIRRRAPALAQARAGRRPAPRQVERGGARREGSVRASQSDERPHVPRGFVRRIPAGAFRRRGGRSRVVRPPLPRRPLRPCGHTRGGDRGSAQGADRCGIGAGGDRPGRRSQTTGVGGAIRPALAGGVPARGRLPPGDVPAHQVGPPSGADLGDHRVQRGRRARFPAGGGQGQRSGRDADRAAAVRIGPSRRGAGRAAEGRGGVAGPRRVRRHFGQGDHRRERLRLRGGRGAGVDYRPDRGSAVRGARRGGRDRGAVRRAARLAPAALVAAGRSPSAACRG